MTTRASQNGTIAAEMEFEATHYNSPESEDEWEAHEGHPYNVPESSHYNSPEFEDEWEAHEGHPYNVPESSHFNSPEFEDEWETHEGHPYNIPESSHYNSPEFEDEWEVHEGHPYNNPYNSPEFEDEWEVHEGHPYNIPESSHYNSPEFEDEADRFIPIIAKAATKLLPHAIRFGRNLFRRMGRGQRSPQQSGGRPVATGSRSRQISALFHQLGRLFAQGEMETASHEAHLFGANEFETEIAGHEMAHQAALSEVLAAEAAHTESESEAQALIGAALPISVRVMGGRVTMRHLTPTLIRVNARLVLNLHRQGRPGRQLISTVPTIQRHALNTIRNIQRTGQTVTPTLAAKVMTDHAARVLTSPHICRRALVRNMQIRRTTVAPSPTYTSRPGVGGRPGMVRRPGMIQRPGMVRRPNMVRAPGMVRRPTYRTGPTGLPGARPRRRTV